MPHAVARSRDIAIAGILAPHESALARIVPKLSSRNLDERPDDPPGAGPNPRQAARSCASHQTEQECLGLIVTRVANRDHISSDAIRGGMQERIPQRAGHILDRPAGVPRSLTHILALYFDRQAECPGKRAAK